MNRRNFLSAIAVVSTASAANAIPAGIRTPSSARSPAAANAAPAAALLLKGTPVAFAPAPDGFTVSTGLGAPARAWVEYGETEALGSVADADPNGFVPHGENVLQIRVSSLRPGVRYFWRLAAAPLFPLPTPRNKATEHSPVYSLKTLAPGAASTQFTVWNDTHDRAETIKRLHAARHAEDDFLLWNGDVSNNVNLRSQIHRLYLSPKGADLAKGPPIFETRGNHDVRGVRANLIREYVAFPGGRPFYAFRSGPLAAIALDTGEDKPDSHPSHCGIAAFEPLIREQTAWLEQAIRMPGICDAPYRVVFCHIPLRWTHEKKPDYAKNGFDHFSLRGRKAWAGALKRWGAQVIISGHTHRVAWLEPTDEFPFVQLTGGGPDLAAATLIHGRADASSLRIEVKKLADGSVLHDATFRPLALI
jgi:predicted phosphodiesterase